MHRTFKWRIVLSLVMLVIVEGLCMIIKASDKITYTPQHPLVISGNATFYPFEYLNEDDKPSGFNVELLQAVMKELRIPYRYEMKKWNNVVQSFQDGKADVICMMYSDERVKKFPMGNTYAYLSLGAVYRQGDKPVYLLSQLKGKRVAVELGSLSDEMVRQFPIKKQ